MTEGGAGVVLGAEVDLHRARAVGDDEAFRDDVLKLVALHVRAQVGVLLGHRLEGVDLAVLADNRRGEERVVADVGADIEEDHAGLEVAADELGFLALVVGAVPPDGVLHLVPELAVDAHPARELDGLLLAGAQQPALKDEAGDAPLAAEVGRLAGEEAERAEQRADAPGRTGGGRMFFS